MPRGVYVRPPKNEHFEAHKKFELEAGLQYCLMGGAPAGRKPAGVLLKEYRNRFAALRACSERVAAGEIAHVWDRASKTVVTSEKGAEF